MGAAIKRRGLVHGEYLFIANIGVVSGPGAPPTHELKRGDNRRPQANDAGTLQVLQQFIGG